VIRDPIRDPLELATDPIRAAASNLVAV